MNLSRRALLGTSVLGLPLALAGCGMITTTTTGGVTTVSVNLVALNDYVQAAQNGAAILLVSPLIAAALGPVKVALIEATIANAAAQIAALTKSSNGVATLTFTASSAPAAIAAIQNDAATILAAASVMFGSFKSTLGTQIQQTVDAFATVIDLMKAAGASTVAAPKLPMAPSAALSLLGVG